MPWVVPKIWDGTCFVLGGGPSLNDINLDLIKDRRVIGVNNAYGDCIRNASGETIRYEPRDWVDVCFFGDARWHGWHKKWLKTFPGLIVTLHDHMHGTAGVLGTEKARKHRNEVPYGISDNPRYVSWNKSSGAAAINLAYLLGCKKIVLLGYDMRRVDDQPNWHTDHPSPNKNPYERFLKPFPYIAKDAKKLGIEIINATPESALKEFPITSLEDFLIDEAF